MELITGVFNSEGIAKGMLVYFIYRDYKFLHKMLDVISALKLYLERGQKVDEFQTTLNDFSRRVTNLEEKPAK